MNAKHLKRILLAAVAGALLTGAGQLYTGDLQRNRPTCDASRRGRFWTENGGYVGVADAVYVCLRDASGLYAWETISFGDPLAVDSITVGGMDNSTPLAAILTSSAEIDFPEMLTEGCESGTVTVAGASTGDTVALGYDYQDFDVNSVFGSPSVFDDGQVSVTYCCVDTGGCSDPEITTFTVTVFHYD